ncbi:hypothetical protein D3C85_798550 [compost metagenome]
MAGLLLKTGEILKAKQPASLRGIGVRPDRVEKQFKLLEYPPPASVLKPESPLSPRIALATGSMSNMTQDHASKYISTLTTKNR